MLQVGTKAPAFTLPDAQGNLISSETFAGKRWVLYFYPKDSTPGCTKQACAFAAAHGEYEALGVPVVGVSKDSQKSHQRFAEKNELPFLLLSDPELTAIQAYDVWKEKKLYGKTSMGVVRTTYVIGPDGVIEWAGEKVKPDQNAQQILDFLTGK
ncbi:MAG: peroxiredoxin [Butyricicoccus pullicaecorum]|uniref:thioredoxin-dependent peroxiredoxin n=1 Tax=Butyricicoccus pullicaecorum TaxID=501571 RepID=A0A1Y4LB50_9FIRM|nr:peroxiredoxin [Butyricicoccus pullicaecorum]MDY2970494.1 peroxiredoxin [Butyricicoccus pullicaecorum]OUP52031.1 peroxiredoxin [Butyricicoccus pullicaecorum]